MPRKTTEREKHADIDSKTARDTAKTSKRQREAEREEERAGELCDSFSTLPCNVLGFRVGSELRVYNLGVVRKQFREGVLGGVC